MGIGTWYFDKINKPYYKDIPFGLLLVNWFFQRIFRINSKCLYSVHYTSKIIGAENINVHESSRISFAVSGGAHFLAMKEGPINIGANVIFAYHVCIQAANHGLLDRKEMNVKPVEIGDNCWIGNNATILAGVTLGKNCTVGANSVVTKSFPDNSVIAGCPAKLIKTV